MKTIGVIFLILAFICWLGARFCEKMINEADHPSEKGGERVMARYIDADKCLDAMLDEMVGTGYQSRAMSVIKYAPTADVVEVKQIEIIRDDLKWWLETNTEKGVVYIPEYVVENMIAKMDGGKTE